MVNNCVRQLINGAFVNHEITGVVFRRQYIRNELWYYDQLKNEEQRAKIGHDVHLFLKNQLDVEHGSFKSLVVRHGDYGMWNYYPLHLVLDSDLGRMYSAVEKRKRPPNERWIMKKRLEVLGELGFM